MASRDLTKNFLERRSAALMRRRTAGDDSSNGLTRRGGGGGMVSGAYICWYLCILPMFIIMNTVFEC